MEFARYFDYKDGDLIWKLSTSNRVKIGSIAGTLRNQGYVYVQLNRNFYPVHRVVWEIFNGPIPEGLQIDHKNNIRNDNRIGNLRLSTQLQNMYNVGLKKSNSSGYKGVDWRKDKKLWRAQIRISGKLEFLGHFKCPTAAALAYRKAAERLHGDFYSRN